MTEHSKASSPQKTERSRYFEGAELAFLAIALLAVAEVWVLFVTETIKSEFLAYQYFRIILEVPLAYFFFIGHKWALWLLRIAFALGIPATVLLCVFLIHMKAYPAVVMTAFIPIIASVAGCWILFASETFLLHFKHKRHKRSIYD